MKLSKLKLLIETQNEEFNKMTKAQKRVRIAEDCIARIKMEQINIATGSLIQSFKIYMVDDLKESLNSDFPMCSACAKGGLFLSYVGRVNNFKGCDLTNDNGLDGSEHKKLLELFSAEQLTNIEFAFEGRQFLGDAYSERKSLKFRKFYLDHGGIYDTKKNPNGSGTEVLDYFSPMGDDMFAPKRMIAICENIIKNEGTFKP